MAEATPATKRQLGRLRKKIAIGSKEADRGKFVDGAKVFADVRERSAQRKRARK